MEHSYPRDLASFVQGRLSDLGKRTDAASLESLLSTAYQASLLREEGRPLSFRLLHASPEAVPIDGGPPRSLLRVRFEHPRRLDEQEIRRVAPAVRLARGMLGVSGDSPESLQLWGLVHTGAGWLRAIEGGRSHAAPLPDALAIAVTGPGRLLVSWGGETIAKLAAGRVTGRVPDVFESRWLPNACADTRRELFAAHARGRAGDEEVDLGLIRRIDQQFVRRVIATVRLAHHGGTIVLLPREDAERVARTARPIALKYPLLDEEPRRRYRALQLRLLDVLARAGLATWSAYAESRAPEVVEIDDALLELAHGVADLAAVDGAVVLSKRFEVIGFGGEIVGDLPDVPVVMRAVDPEGDERVPEATDHVGTRHRSVYRLVAALPEALGIVVSQDGGVRLVAQKDGSVTYWDQLGTGPMEL